MSYNSFWLSSVKFLLAVEKEGFEDTASEIDFLKISSQYRGAI
jgi:hypothetical protein